MILFPPFDKANLKVSSLVNIKNLISCFWNWIQGENSSNYVLTLDLNQEPMDYISQIKDGVIAGQHFNELKAKHLETKTLFEDPIFKPNDSSLHIKHQDQDVLWERASKLAENPRFFVDGASRFDIRQGLLGNCWVLASLANLTLNKKLFQKVVPPNQSFDKEEYTGIFHFQFWYYGEWVDVVVDDYLPVKDVGILGKKKFVYLQNSESNIEYLNEYNEFWAALLEKAYAKLHGSYQKIDFGFTSDSMEDFSGGLSERYMLTKDSSPIETFNILKKAYEKGSMICISTPGYEEKKLPSGLVLGHAYTITKVLQIQIEKGPYSGIHNLIRIRNPYGNEVEWNKRWSDLSEEMKSLSKEEKKMHGIIAEHDGEFFMSIEDVVQTDNFEFFEICNLTPESGNEFSWHMQEFHGSWRVGLNAGGCHRRYHVTTFHQNPQFLIELEDSDDDDGLCTCVVALMRKNHRQDLDNVIFIGFSVYPVSSPESTILPLSKDFFADKDYLPLVDSNGFNADRQVHTRMKLRPGTYVIIPTTEKPNIEADFLLRIFSEKTSTNLKSRQDDDRV